MASLKLSGVDKIFPSGSLALYDINLETRDKEFIVVVGGEKSGKSTLLRLISGLDDLSDGEIFIGGKEVSSVDPKDRDVAMVFKSNTLYPTMSVYDNMAFGLKLRKASQTLIDQRVKSAANILGLNDVLFRKPKALTSAQKQKVAIGRAIVREPKLYLFDEPLSGLDENLKSDILNIIVNLQARMEGTFVYCTKNIAEAMTIGTRIVVLKDGIVQQIDTPSNLYDYPANAYVAFYIGSPTINFVNKAKVLGGEEGTFVEQGEFKVKLSDKILSRFENVELYKNTEKSVILGLRPEDATLSLSGDGLDVKVTKVENDGDNTYAECEVGGHSLIVKAENNVTAGTEAKLSIDLDRLYLFDGETRLTLLNRDEGYVKTDFPEADIAPLAFNEEEEIKKNFKPQKDSKKKK